MTSPAEAGIAVETPLMKQYNAIKGKYPDAILLFRVGDFYETFGEDAIKASKLLGIVLTKRKNGAASFVELAGFPHHSLENYLPKLVRAGNRVAICDQLEDPKLTKKLVKRGITELVTPGVSYQDKTIDLTQNSFLAAVHIDGSSAGVALLDISTGEFYASEGDFNYVDKLLQGFQPNEVLYSKATQQIFQDKIQDRYFTHRLDEWAFGFDFGYEKLVRQFGTSGLKGFGVDELRLGIAAAGAILHYLEDTQHLSNQHITGISRLDQNQYVWLDKFTVRNLELITSAHDQGTALIQILDHTVTSMGSRKLRNWLLFPLLEKEAIEARHEAVRDLTADIDHLESLQNELKQIGDLERLVSKIANGRINPREILQLMRSLRSIEVVCDLLKKYSDHRLGYIAGGLEPLPDVSNRIEREIQDNPPIQISKGGVIQEGYSSELDELRNLAFSGKDYLLKIQQQETDRTGISSLKVAYNSVFGYYLEVRNTHKDKVPTHWIRKQTLTQAERYVTEELKEYEEKILGAEEKIQELEQGLYNSLIAALLQWAGIIQKNAQLLAELDCLVSLAKVAIRNQYVKPNIHSGTTINILNGRHPVIEKLLPPGETYVSNDVYLDPETQQIMMITGPNMSGKSALLRQTALIVIMAQMGSFVPASAADIGIVDKIFTRVGANDNLSGGESTFMVEMNETASILNNLSDRSLVLLDEIGRGTSTYDGVSIAWAIAEYLHEHPHCKPKTLFATHYHELNEMTDTFNRIKNFNVSIKEAGQKIIFLRKLQSGGSNHSFGIHVAKMAGMPVRVIEKAKAVLAELEASRSHKTLPAGGDSGMQLSFFQLDDPTLGMIREQLLPLEIDRLTPVEALIKLNELKKILTGG
jgi:DNA mismatch repair protein MutS